MSEDLAGRDDGTTSGPAVGDLDRLYGRPLPATRTGPIYNAISYPTKISAETVAVFIATHTDPGSTVLDTFGGSGSTGLAALLCDKPTDRMRQMAKDLGLSPRWGPRTAVIYELSVLGAFIAQTMCSPPDPEEFDRVATELLDDVERAHGWIYAAESPDGSEGQLRHTIWSEVLVCPSCATETTYFDAAVHRGPLRLGKTFTCVHCGTKSEIDRCARATESVHDPLLKRDMERRKRVPAHVYGRNPDGNWDRAAAEDDLRLAEKAASIPLPASAPRTALKWGDLHRAGYHHGMTHIQHFYTPRNFFALSALWDRIEKAPSEMRPALRLLVLSYNASHSTLMTRVVVKTGGKEFVLTGAQSGVLYVSGLPVEKNVFSGLRRKIKTLTAAFSQVAESGSEVRVVNASSTSIDLPDSSISYVFTDPPFGGYIPYAEINQINEAWLGSVTDRNLEAIVSPAQGKDVDAYASLMAKVFNEVSRVLRDDGRGTVVFHSAEAQVWRALCNALAGAGLGVDLTSVLDKVQASFKQTVSTTAVKGDPVMLVSKRATKARRSRRSAARVIDEVVKAAEASPDAAEKSKERMYSRFISRCLKEGVPVTVDASEFYDVLERRQGPA